MRPTSKRHLVSTFIGFAGGAIFGAGSFYAWSLPALDRSLHTIARPLAALMPSPNADQDFAALAVPLTCGLIAAALALLASLLMPHTKAPPPTPH